MNKKHFVVELLPRTLWAVIALALILVEYNNVAPAALVEDRVLMVVGIIFAVVGVLYLIWSGYYIFRPMFTKELVIAGPYRLARHPVYLAMYIALTGFGLLFFSWVWFVVLLAAMPLWYLVCRAEEDQMKELYPEQYSEYKKRVAMFLPRPIILTGLLALIILAAMATGIYFKYPGQLAPADETPPTEIPVLYLGMMIHLEGWFAEVDNEDSFNDHATATRALASTLEQYGAKGTFEAGPEFVRGSSNWNDNILGELAAAGHGVGVHADVGGNVERESLDQESMAEILREMKFDFEKASGVEAQHVSGICSTLDWVEAAIQAGYQFTTGGVAYCVMSMPEEERPEEFRDCVNPGLCHDVFPTEVEDRINPWRMSTGDDWLEHDSEGELVYLASDGLLYGYDKINEEIGSNEPMTQEDVDGFIVALEESLAAVEEDQINMMYVSWSIGNASRATSPAIETWLQAVEPYVNAGLVEWATLPEVYDKYVQWETGEPVETSGQFWGRTSAEDTSVIYEDLEYAVADGVSLKLDLYRPSGYGYDVPLLVWTHGGGWSGGDKSNEASMCERLALAGYAVASLNFRSSDQAIFPAQVHDVKAAVRWLRANGAEYGIDTEKIGAIGSSSGGHLAAMLGLTANDEVLEGGLGDHLDQSSSVQAVVDMFGPVDLTMLDSDCADFCKIDHRDPDSPESRLLGCTLNNFDCHDAEVAASPVAYVTEDDPPFLIIHGDEDPTIPIAQSQKLMINLSHVGVEAEFIKAKGYEHDRSMFWDYVGQIVAFFDEHLK